MQSTLPSGGTPATLTRIVAMAIIALLCAQPAAATARQKITASEAADLYQNPTAYRIVRKGKTIGSHRVSFGKTQSKLEVTIESNIRVTILKLPVFTFKYTATEIWEDNQLVSVVSRTVENGNKKNMSLQSSGNSSVLVNNNRRTSVKRLNYTSNHWHPAVLTADAQFNTLTGKSSNTTSEFIGEEGVVTSSQTLPGKRYRYDGDINADVWYDPTGRWIKLRFLGNDGSIIEYIID